jgi:hypothetical protein
MGNQYSNTSFEFHMAKRTSYETLHYAVFSNLPPPYPYSVQISPSAPCSQTPSVYVPLFMSKTKSHVYRTTGKTTILYILPHLNKNNSTVTPKKVWEQMNWNTADEALCRWPKKCTGALHFRSSKPFLINKIDLQHVQSSSGPNWLRYPMGIEPVSPRVKGQRREADLLPSAGVDVKNTFSCRGS